MAKKLTLSIHDDELVDLAKDYAANSGRTLSGLVEEFFSQITTKSKQKNKTVTLKSGKVVKLTGPVAELAGFLNGLDPDLDYKKEYREARAHKYYELDS